MKKRNAVILAAGQGTRMKSKLYKVLHPVLGRPMLEHVLDQLEAVKLDKRVTIVGHGAEQVVKLINDRSECVRQDEQLGTGHAVLQAESLLKDIEGTTIVVCGDTPLITEKTYKELFEHHEITGAAATILTADVPDPTGYGRVIRNGDNEVEKVVEHKDANAEERNVTEINTGTYCFDNQALFEALHDVSNDNVQGEYYLPDAVEIIRRNGGKVSGLMTSDFSETLGINDRKALAEAEKIMRRRVNEKHLKNGVTMLDVDTTYIGMDVIIEQDVMIHPGTHISGHTVIKEGAEIGPYADISDSTIGQESTIQQSVVENSVVGNQVKIGPYAHIRPEADIQDEVKIGNFVEVKKSTIGSGSKVPHLSYIGDAAIGRKVNMGCGTITVNYDGVKKHRTVIEDDAFIGCNANLIAPLSIGRGSFIAAGSTITKDVPEDSLSVARGRQTNKEGYASRLKNRKNN
ncbi:MAG TPA: bifunctional UDP-N-acetylglucosamine diphosphorylase/glucosamine-1-phosphate N-acetyltransferase GlmU [Virgibacillus sp.]|nr:bifunctional UDP-N-acetylglucosamine diphosphorylase/glucosamine-1-phosphate N-acetyltransferase GlmU [Virgibacillus sp.]